MAHDDSIFSDRLYTEAEFLEHAREERLFVFDFTIQRAYGNFR